MLSLDLVLEPGMVASAEPLQLMAVPAPTVREVTPPVIVVGESTTVRFAGLGFARTPGLSCRLAG